MATCEFGPQEKVMVCKEILSLNDDYKRGFDSMLDLFAPNYLPRIPASKRPSDKEGEQWYMLM